MALFKEILPLRVIPHWSVGEVRQSGKNASENLIRRTFSGVIFRSILGPRYSRGIHLLAYKLKLPPKYFLRHPRRMSSVLHGREGHCGTDPFRTVCRQEGYIDPATIYFPIYQKIQDSPYLSFRFIRVALWRKGLFL